MKKTFDRIIEKEANKHYKRINKVLKRVFGLPHMAAALRELSIIETDLLGYIGGEIGDAGQGRKFITFELVKTHCPHKLEVYVKYRTLEYIVKQGQESICFRCIMVPKLRSISDGC